MTITALPSPQAVRIGHRRGELDAKSLSWSRALEEALSSNRRLKLLDSRQLLCFIQSLADPAAASVVPLLLIW